MQDFNLAKIVPYYRFQGKRFEGSGLDVQSSKFKDQGSRLKRQKNLNGSGFGGQGSGVGSRESGVRNRESGVWKAEEKERLLAARFARRTQTIKTDNNHFSPADFGRRKGCHGLRPGRNGLEARAMQESGVGGRGSEVGKEKENF